MTGASPQEREQQFGQGPELQRGPEICQVSLNAVRSLTGPMIEALGDHTSVLYDVMNYRIARMEGSAQLDAVVSRMAIDPMGSGIILPRYQLQGGEIPEDAAATVASADQMISLWTVDNDAKIPPLIMPPGADDKMMYLAAKSQMMGGGPVIFAREDLKTREEEADPAKNIVLDDDSLIEISAAARNAVWNRIKSAMELREKNPHYKHRILLTADPTRQLSSEPNGGERKVVESFAPKATNELELAIDSAKKEGFVMAPDQEYGFRYLPDGTGYMLMYHPEKDIEMAVVTPAKQSHEKRIRNADGSEGVVTVLETGLFNSHAALLKHGDVLTGRKDFKLSNSRLVYVTSTHYGLMGALNNLEFVHRERTSLKGFVVLGDNQPKTRKAQAHNIEFATAIVKLDDMAEDPYMYEALFPQTAEDTQ
jgi:hypothetical protein